MAERSDQRAQFLSDLLITAIEHSGYGFPGRIEYVPEPGGDPHGTYAVIYDRYEYPDGPELGLNCETWLIDLDTMEKGLAVVRGMDSRVAAGDWLKLLLLADRTDGEYGDYDVVGALLVLECALFGEGVYV